MAPPCSTRRRLLAASVPLALAVAGCASTGDDGATAADDEPTTSTAASTASTTAGTAGDGTPESTDGDGETTDDEAASTAPFPALESGDPTFRRFQPVPDDVAWVFNAAHNVSRLRERRDRVPASTYESNSLWATFGGYVGVEYDEMDGVLVGLGAPASVVMGSYARADVESRLRATPYEQYTTSGGVTYFERTDTDPAQFVGVGDDGVVVGPADREASDPGRTFVTDTTPIFEARRGNRPRYHEANDRYRRYTDAVGWPLIAGATVPRPIESGGVSAGAGLARAVDDDVAASVRFAYGQHVADGSLVDRYWLRVTDDAELAPDAVADAFRTSDARQELTADGQSLAVRRDGPVVEVGVLDPVDDPGGGADPVLAAFDATLEGTTFALAHLAGDDLPLSRVTVLAGSEEVDSVGDGTLTAGESLTVDVPSGTETVRVIYTPPHADSQTVIAQS